MVVDYRKFRRRYVLTLIPCPSLNNLFSIYQELQCFLCWILTPPISNTLTPQSRRITAFCIPCGLYEFNKLPMRLSIASQVLSLYSPSNRQINLFAYLTGNMDNLVVYSASISELQVHLRYVLGKLRSDDFTLNKKICWAKVKSST
jgi:hypothetical protein